MLWLNKKTYGPSNMVGRSPAVVVLTVVVTQVRQYTLAKRLLEWE